MRRSCEDCRRQKIRCINLSGASSHACQRCERLHLDCIYDERKTRRPGVTLRSRLKTLERAVDDLQQVDHVGTVTGPTQSVLVPLHQSLPPIDVLAEGPLTSNVAAGMLHLYKSTLQQLYPMVWIASDADLSMLRVTRPILLLSILTASASHVNSILHDWLQKQLDYYLGYYLGQCVTSSSISLEDYISAQLLAVIWSTPPKEFGNECFLPEYYDRMKLISSCVAVTDAYVPSTSENSTDQPQIGQDISICADDLRLCAADTSLIDARSHLASEILTNSVSLSVRKLELLSSQHSGAELIQQWIPAIGLGGSSNMDLCLLSWAKLFHIARDFLSDTSRWNLPVSVMKHASCAERIEQRMSVWALTAPKAIVATNSWLWVAYHAISLNINEYVLYNDHDRADFAAPYTLSRLRPRKTDFECPFARLRYGYERLLYAAHALIDTFLDCPIQQVRVAPPFVLGRTVYAAYVLAKMEVTVAYSTSEMPAAFEAKVLGSTTYVARLIGRFQEIQTWSRAMRVEVFKQSLIQLQTSLGEELRLARGDGSMFQPLSYIGNQHLDPISEQVH